MGRPVSCSVPMSVELLEAGPEGAGVGMCWCSSTRTRCVELDGHDGLVEREGLIWLEDPGEPAVAVWLPISMVAAKIAERADQ
jgi:hypothetical protein